MEIKVDRQITAKTNFEDLDAGSPFLLFSDLEYAAEQWDLYFKLNSSSAAQIGNDNGFSNATTKAIDQYEPVVPVEVKQIVLKDFRLD